jgi:spore coat protein A, manganese oxidase
MISRRQFLKAAVISGVSLAVPGSLAKAQSVKAAAVKAREAEVRRAQPTRVGAQNSLPTLDPYSIPKYISPLVIPPAMPRTTKVKQKGAKNIDYYEIGVRQFQQQILPTGFPVTTVWGYGSVNHPNTFNYPSFTIEAKVNKPVRVKWVNELMDMERQLSASSAASGPHPALGQPARWRDAPRPRAAF